MTSNTPMVDILHLHGFKCAGTTFASILQSNYGPGVAYIESQDPGDRLPWQLVPEVLDLDAYQAVSSHLVALPSEGQSFARLHVAFVRDPRQRIKSAYRFQRQTGKLKSPEEGFTQFLQRMRTSKLSNYQTRHLSPQDYGGWEKRAGWQLRPELIDFERSDLFVGVVERFDESMVLLERILADVGVPFDGSYPAALNVGAATNDALTGIPVDIVELDEVLYERACRHLTAAMLQVDNFAALLSDFRQRCAARTSPGGLLQPPPSSSWTYVDPRKFVANPGLRLGKPSEVPGADK